MHIARPAAAISRVSSIIKPSSRPDSGSASRRWQGGWAPSLLLAWVLLIALAVGVAARPSAARPWLLLGSAIAADGAGSYSGEAPLPPALEGCGRKLLDEAAPTFTGWFAKKWTRVFPQQWAAYRSNLQRLRLASDDDSSGGSSGGGKSGGAAITEEPRVLAPHVAALLSGSELLNPAQMARSLAYMGGGHRLRRVLRDLAAGGAAGQDGPDGPRQPVKIAVLGGSISWGSAVTGGHDDWFTLVAARLREAFPRAKVVARNGCVPATPSSFMNMCLENYLDDDVDLVFLEYATNDGWDIHNEPKK
jgi:hypothetical protein